MYIHIPRHTYTLCVYMYTCVYMCTDTHSHIYSHIYMSIICVCVYISRREYYTPKRLQFSLNNGNMNYFYDLLLYIFLHFYVYNNNSASLL